MTQIREPERRSRILRGRPYSLDEFASKYGLLSHQAESLFTRFGPSSIELDLLMAAKRRLPVRHEGPVPQDGPVNQDRIAE
ncbi:hypothetical protein GR197_17925 [Rhizobium phaseoli]|jgi:hypothetical protein|uniref:Uncharacterized protein n=1 Tax=Rhizobium phaseoli TaxID=396 RepID=A0A7K3UGE4_9HYPH|nr:hypothetical protein [Rhizobium phaseoli]NEJ72394.1 hypothetical protein [Rhizobium phaseoli]